MILSGAPHIVVLGLMGVGKSTTAHAVADTRSLPCFDSDKDIESWFGRTGSQIVASLGIEELHHIESAMLLGRLAKDEPSVISAAASVIENDLCRRALGQRAQVVILHAEIDEILRRAATSDHRRTIPKAELIALAERRNPLFKMAADLELDATRSTAELVAQVTAYLTT